MSFVRYFQCIKKIALGLLVMAVIGCNSEQAPLPVSVAKTAELSLSISDSATEVREVVMSIEAIELIKSSGSITRIERFYNELTQQHTLSRISFDLLDYQGIKALQILNAFSVPQADYEDVVIYFSEDNYVTTALGEQKPLIVMPLMLGPLDLTASDEPDYVIEIDLNAALVFDEQKDDYQLASVGTRIIAQAAAGQLSGLVDTSFYQAALRCSGDTLSQTLYLYALAEINERLSNTLEPLEASSSPKALSSDQLDGVKALLGDHFDPNTKGNNDKINPYTSVNLGPTGSYEIGYIAKGEYLAVYTCEAGHDQAAQLDDIDIANLRSQTAIIAIDNVHSLFLPL